jgi:hypothetical protein
MIRQLQNFDDNTLALEVVDGFTESDETICQQYFQEKLNKGFRSVNVLVKLDKMSMTQTSVKAFFEDILWTLRNYHKMGHLAIVAHSNILKALVPIDNLFFQRASKGRMERYFDISQLNEALQFVRKPLPSEAG